MRVGPDLPTERQLAYLQRLSAAAGQRYVPPRTRAQARSRITDLELIVGDRQRQPRQKAQPASVEHSPLAPLLRNLERAHYNGAPQHVIRRLQQKIEARLAQ